MSAGAVVWVYWRSNAGGAECYVECRVIGSRVAVLRVEDEDGEGVAHPRDDLLAEAQTDPKVEQAARRAMLYASCRAEQ